MFTRVLLIALVAYLGYRFFKTSVGRGGSSTEVKGKQANKPLDLGDSEVSDAKFEDIEEET